MKSDRCPGRILLRIKPITIIWLMITPNTVTEAHIDMSASKTSMTASNGAQGRPKVRRSVAMKRSRLVSSIRVVSIAIVMQLKPRTSGRMPFPFRPTFLRTRSSRTESLGR